MGPVIPLEVDRAHRELGRAHRLALAIPSRNFAPLDGDQARRILLRGPNRIGKTWHLCRLVARRLVDQPGARWRFVSPTNAHVQTVAGEYLADFLAPYLDVARSYYVPGRGWNGGRSREILLGNGSVCELRSGEDDMIAHSGSALDGVAMDEPPKREHLTENSARLMDRSGQMIIGATMVGRPVGWLRQMVEGEEPSPSSGRTVHGSGWVQYVARLDREHCPWYTQDQIDAWVRQWASAPWEYAQRVEGAWEGISDDRYLAAFSAACITTDEPPTDRPISIGIGLDHGHAPGTEAAVLLVWWTDDRRRRRLLVLDEAANDAGQTDEAIGRMVLDLLRRNGIDPYAVDEAIGDIGKAGDGWRMNETVERGLLLAMGGGRRPFRFVTPDKSDQAYEWGLRVVNYGLGRGDLKVHQRCRRVTSAMQHWNGDISPRNMDKHWIDASRYVTVAALSDVRAYVDLRV